MRTWTIGLVGLGAAVALVAPACGGGSSKAQQRHVSAQLKLAKDYTASSGQHVVPRAVDVLKVQLTNRRAVRANRSPAFARALARRFQRIDRRTALPVPRPAPGGTTTARRAGLGVADDAFDPSVAVFAYDDSSGEWLDAQYLDPASGAFDLTVADDSPVSLWVGTYDETAGSGDIIMPMTYGFDYELPPSADDVSFDYNDYMYVDPSAFPDDAYLAATSDNSGYYQVDYTDASGTPGTSYLYLVTDDPSVGSYWLIWDDGTCDQGTEVYIALDATGSYFSVNGVDAPFSMSGVSASPGYFDGDARWTVVGDDGYSYEVLATITYLADAAPTDVCAADTLVVPADPSVCPAGCSLDPSFGICTIDGTLDDTTGIGLSCDLVDVAQPLIVCPAGCAELIPSDGFCYDNNGDPTAPICI